MSETTVTCNKCGELVPKKRFCGECGQPLALSVNQPTASQGDRDSTPVQVSSISLEINESTNEQSTDIVNKQPTLSSMTINRHTDGPNETTKDTSSSYAEAASVGSRPSGEGSQQNNLTERVPNNGPGGSSGMMGNVTVTEQSNNGTSGASKATEKV